MKELTRFFYEQLTEQFAKQINDLIRLKIAKQCSEMAFQSGCSDSNDNIEFFYIRNYEKNLPALEIKFHYLNMIFFTDNGKFDFVYHSWQEDPLL